MKRTLNSLFFILACVLIFGSFVTAPAEQLFPTRMKIIILNSLGNYEDSVKVTLYQNKEDFRNSENAVSEPQYTDKKGKVIFDDLEPKSYYIDAVKGDKNNYGGAQLTPQLDKGKLNKVNIVIE